MSTLSRSVSLVLCLFATDSGVAAEPENNVQKAFIKLSHASTYRMELHVPKIFDVSIDIVSPDRAHAKLANRPIEMIEIGGKRYSKTGDNAWQQLSNDKPLPISGSFTQIVEVAIKQSRDGTVTDRGVLVVDSVPEHVYEMMSSGQIGTVPYAHDEVVTVGPDGYPHTMARGTSIKTDESDASVTFSHINDPNIQVIEPK